MRLVTCCGQDSYRAKPYNNKATTKTESIIDVRPCEEGRMLINDTGKNKPSLRERRPENQFYPLLELVGRRNAN